MDPDLPLEFTVDEPGRLDKFLSWRIPGVSRARVAEHIAAGHVRVEGFVRTKGSHALQTGEHVELTSAIEDRTPQPLEPADIPLDVLYEDDELLVVDKPRGLATHPAPSLHEPTLVNALLGRGASLSGGSADFRPGIVHRLDKETTGLLVVAKTDYVHAELSRQIAAKEADRRYLAIVHGKPDRERFRIDGPIARDPNDRLKMAIVADGKSAATGVRTLRPVEAGTLLACRLETGRTHQIRVHLTGAGHPIVGDPLYGRGHEEVPMQLHAARLQFVHPADGTRRTFFSAPPLDFLAFAEAEELEF